MNTKTTRFLGSIAALALTGSMLTGCPKQETATGEAPYGQAAPATTTTTPPVAGDTAPPGPRMGSAPDTMSGAGTDPSAPGVPPGPKMGGSSAGGAMAGGPMTGGSGPMAPLTPTPELDKAIEDAEAKKDKKGIAAAYASRGFSRMTDDNAGQRIKYREALKDFRIALKNDPANVKAKQNKATIEEIYTSMGRPIPE